MAQSPDLSRLVTVFIENHPKPRQEKNLSVTGTGEKETLLAKERVMSKVDEDDVRCERPKRESPWAKYDAERRASARKYNDLRNRIRLGFRGLQQEAYASYCAWEQEMDEAEEEPDAEVEDASGE